MRDVLIHNTGNAEEFSRVLEEHMEGHPVDTRSFEEREGTYRAMTDVELWSAFVARCERLVDTADAAEQELLSETAITWTGRTVTPDVFAEHIVTRIPSRRGRLQWRRGVAARRVPDLAVV